MERRVKLVPISEEDLERLRVVASTIGVPLRELISRVFREGASLALLSGGNLSLLESEYRALRELGRLGFALLPVSTLNKIVNGSPNLDEALEDAREVGRGIGTIYRLSDISDEQHVIGLIRAVFPDSTQINIKEDGDTLTLTVVAIARTRESMSLSSKLIEGFFEGLGYAHVSSEIAGGLLVSIYRRQKR